MTERTLGGVVHRRARVEAATAQVNKEVIEAPTRGEQIKAILGMGVGVGATLGLAIAFAAANKFEFAGSMIVLAIGGGATSYEEVKRMFPDKHVRIGRPTRFLPPHLEGPAAVMRFDINRSFSPNDMGSE